MERRNFLKKALVATGALTIPSINLDAFGSVNMRKTESNQSALRKSIMWGTVGGEGSVLEKCKAVKAAGYDGIEPNSHMDRQEVLDAMKATGLIASSVCCSTHWNSPLSSPDEVIRQKGIDGAIVALEDAKAYGTDAILLVPGKVDDTVSYDECWNRSTECIKKLIPIAKKLKVVVCIENVWNNFLLSPMEAKNYVDQFKSPYVKFYFDCGNILVYGWPEQWINILGDRIGRIHIKEFSNKIADQKGRWQGFNVKLTEGDVNWPKVMQNIRKSYKGGWLTTEMGASGQEELSDLCKRLDKILTM
ncbi:MAG: sugar phosphate isomerase/epimerase [Prevotella sp.]|jgi:hexulose-6-phosphate isomerase|nr:sugar phosphate isomerase/epimerase [Prevotella sp.]